MPDSEPPQPPTMGALALSVTITLEVKPDLYLLPEQPLEPPQPDRVVDTQCIVCPICDQYTMYYGVGCSDCGTSDVR